MLNPTEQTTEDLFHISGDPDRGIAAEYDLRKTALAQLTMRYEGRHAHPYKARKVVCELYETDGKLSVHTVCTRCGKALWISSDNKKIDYDATRKLLFVEPFTCTWDLGDENNRQEFGLGLCSTRVAYDGMLIKDA